MNDKVNVRMCFVCRKNIAKEQMLRIAVKDNEAFLDKTFKGGGRGTYICSLECFKKAEKTKRLNAVFKGKVSVELLDEIESEFNNG